MASVFVGNLAWSCTEQQLGDYFSKYGEIESVRIALDRETGRSRGFAHVAFMDADCANRAVNEANGVEIEGRQIRTDHGRPRN